jgi:peptidoglycan/xylan/chitin deacetylase (PgdA/CDA1 family)
MFRLHLKNFLGYIGQASGVVPLALRMRRIDEGLIVLSFHRVVKTPYYRAQMAISREAFAQLLDYLVAHADVVDLADAVRTNGEPGRQGGRPKVALTFDDGYRDNFEHALPELQKRALTATVFLVTGFLDDSSLYPWWDGLAYVLNALEHVSEDIRNDVLRLFQKSAIVSGELAPPFSAAAINAVVDQVRTMPESARRDLIDALVSTLTVLKQARPRIMLNWAEARAMTAAGIQFGAHTVTHPNLTDINRLDVLYEFEKCRDRIQQETGQEVTAFAYPGGQFSDTVVEVVRDLKFEMGCTTVPGVYRPGMDRFLIPRIDISDNAIRGVRTAFSPSMWHFQLLRHAK